MNMWRVGFVSSKRWVVVWSVLCLSICSSGVFAQSDRMLVDRYDKMYEAERYEAAMKAAQEICDRYPESSGWRFKYGTMLIVLEREDEGIEHLKVCVELGYSGIGSFEHNTDLDPVRDREDFGEVLARVRANADARIGEFQKEARAHKPKVYVPDVKEGEKAGEKPALIIALHGTGMDGVSMYDALIKLAKEKGAILICPDGLREAGDGFSWTYRDESEWFVEYLIDRAIEEHNADRDRVMLFGFSQGANIGLVMGQLHGERFAGVVAMSGHYEEQNASSEGEVSPFYLMIGSRDPWKKTYARAKRDFESQDVRVRMRVVQGKGHELLTGDVGLREYRRAYEWVLGK